MNPYALTGRHILVTGASSGIGRATAEACARMGAIVTCTGRDRERLQAVADSLAAPTDSTGASHRALCCDVTSEADIDALVAELGKVDGLALCAGWLQTVPTRYIDRESLLRQFDTNYFSVALLVARLLQGKRINKGASIVAVTSVAADSAAETGNAIYSSTKGALQAYCRVLAKELAGRRIRVNCIAPGMVRTPFLANFEADQEQLAVNEQKYPLGYGTPEDVAYAAVYLLSEASKWMTGSTLRIDGGLSL